MNVARVQGIGIRDPRFPIIQMENWPVPEYVTGISKGHDVPIIGAGVMRATMTELGKDSGPEIIVRAKISREEPATGSG